MIDQGACLKRRKGISAHQRIDLPMSRRPTVLIAAIALAATACAMKPQPPQLLHDSAPAIDESWPVPTGAQEIVLHQGNAVIAVYIAPDHFSVSQEQLLDWVKTGAHAVSNFYFKFPVPHVAIYITREGDGDEIHGTEYDGTLIRMRLGPNVGETALADDWTMTHEMLHLAFPNMGDKHLWMNEGLSVYLEPICRARIGIVSPRRYWRELVEGLENGQPDAGDQGLDNTHTWGRTYWGGTMFWFLADVRIRKETNNDHSVDDAVRTILGDGGDGSKPWPMQRVLDVGDQATGTHVLADLYSELATHPVHVDFNPWWKWLGVEYENGDVRFDDSAPGAAVRRSITQRLPGHF